MLHHYYNQTLHFLQVHLLISLISTGVMTLFITNPIWVVKTRLCLQYDGIDKKLDTGRSGRRYRGMLDALYKIYRYEGLRGLYKVSSNNFFVSALDKTLFHCKLTSSRSILYIQTFLWDIKLIYFLHHDELLFCDD